MDEQQAARLRRLLGPEFGVGDVVQMKKTHPCGSDRWTVTRVGADVKIKCLGCGRLVMLERAEFVKRLKKVLERKAAEGENTDPA